MEVGVSAYELLLKHAAELLPAGAGVDADDLVVALLTEALAAREKRAKR